MILFNKYGHGRIKNYSKFFCELIIYYDEFIKYECSLWEITIVKNIM